MAFTKWSGGLRESRWGEGAASGGDVVAHFGDATSLRGCRTGSDRSTVDWNSTVAAASSALAKSHGRARARAHRFSHGSHLVHVQNSLLRP